MAERTCLHCGEAFNQSGRGAPRQWCYVCLSQHGDVSEAHYRLRAGQLKSFKENGLRHSACCGLKICRDCGDPFAPWSRSKRIRTTHVRCRPCDDAHGERRRAAARQPLAVKVCPVCRRSSALGRRTYCSEFCRLVGRRFGYTLRNYVQLQGEFRRASRWWIQSSTDHRWLAGPPPHPLDVWVTPDDTWLCPHCANEMMVDDQWTRSCWCGTRVQSLTQESTIL